MWSSSRDIQRRCTFTSIASRWGRPVAMVFRKTAPVRRCVLRSNRFNELVLIPAKSLMSEPQRPCTEIVGAIPLTLSVWESANG